MSTLREDLMEAKALIDAPEKWGHVIPWPSNKKCATEALEAVGARYAYGHLAKYIPWRFRVKFWFSGLRNLPDWQIIRFNDLYATHADIMALFDRAIAAAGDA